MYGCGWLSVSVPVCLCLYLVSAISAVHLTITLLYVQVKFGEVASAPPVMKALPFKADKTIKKRVCLMLIWH